MMINFNGDKYLLELRQVVFGTVGQAQLAVEKEAETQVPRDRGTLLRTIHPEGPYFQGKIGVVGFVVAGGEEAPYAVFLERGTGIKMDPPYRKYSYFDPATGQLRSFNAARTKYAAQTGWYIIPRAAKAMFLPGIGFRTRVKGVAAKHWLRQSMFLSVSRVETLFAKLKSLCPHLSFVVTAK